MLLGRLLGLELGEYVGPELGLELGSELGELLGLSLGKELGELLGLSLGKELKELLGLSPLMSARKKPSNQQPVEKRGHFCVPSCANAHTNRVAC